MAITLINSQHLGLHIYNKPVKIPANTGEVHSRTHPIVIAREENPFSFEDAPTGGFPILQWMTHPHELVATLIKLSGSLRKKGYGIGKGP